MQLMEAILKLQACAVIDRCHCTAGQRTDFIDAAHAAGCQVCLPSRSEPPCLTSWCKLPPAQNGIHLSAQPLLNPGHAHPAQPLLNPGHAHPAQSLLEPGHSHPAKSVLVPCHAPLLTLTYGQAHALVLQLDANLCARRAEARQGHEGGLEGAGARTASQRLSAQLRKDPPTMDEEFASIMVSSSTWSCLPQIKAGLCHVQLDRQIVAAGLYRMSTGREC